MKWSGRAGVLAKCPRPQQDLRVDMPTIGVKTVDAAIGLDLAGIVVEAGRVMIVDRAEAIRRADAAGLFIVGEELSGAGVPAPGSRRAVRLGLRCHSRSSCCASTFGRCKRFRGTRRSRRIQRRNRLRRAHGRAPRTVTRGRPQCRGFSVPRFEIGT